LLLAKRRWDKGRNKRLHSLKLRARGGRLKRENYNRGKGHKGALLGSSEGASSWIKLPKAEVKNALPWVLGMSLVAGRRG